MVVGEFAEERFKLGALVGGEFVDAWEVALRFDVLVNVHGSPKGKLNELALLLDRRARRHEVEDIIPLFLRRFDDAMKMVKVFA